MNDKLKPGVTCEKREIVTEEKTALAFGSGTVRVYATPAMVALMENAAYNCVDPLLAEGLVSVGAFINVTHAAATPLGMEVCAKAKLISAEDKRLEFYIEVYDEKEKIGEGRHSRYIVKREKFMQKALDKLATSEKTQKE